MIKSIFCFLALFIFLSPSMIGQDDILFKNIKPYDTERYLNFNGSAYLFEEPTAVKVYAMDREPIEGIVGNYNMAEGELEIYKGNSYLELKKNQYPKVEFIDSDGNLIRLISVSHPKLSFGYCIQHFADDSFMILEQRKRLKSSVKIQTPGKTESIDKFKKSKDFFILKNGQLIEFKTSKKKIIKKFGHKKEIKEYIKSNKLKLKKMEDVISLFQFIDNQGWLI